MKKFLCLLIAVATLFCGVSCGKEAAGDKEISGDKEEQVLEVDPNAVLMSMRESQVGFPQYTTASSHDESGKEIEGWQDIFSLSLYDDFDAKKVKSYAIAYSTVQTADEITVVVLKSKADAEEFKRLMKSRVSTRITLFETYGPSEVAKLEKAKIISKDNVCALIISDDPEKAAQEFKNHLR